MYYKQKPKTYPGRGIVRAIQAVLVVAVMMIVTVALLDRFETEPSVETVNTQSLGTVELNVRPEAQPYTNEPLSMGNLWEIALDYHLNDDYYQAINYYTRGIVLDDVHPAFYLNRGVAYEQTRQADLSMRDFWTYIQNNSHLTLTRLDYQPGETVSIEMAPGRTYRFPFRAPAGAQITATAQAANGETVDPLIVILDRNDNPLASNDDIIVNGELQSMNSYIGGFTAPHSCMYTLVVHHAGGGSYGTVNVSLDIVE